MNLEIVKAFRESKSCDLIVLNNGIDRSLNFLIDDIIDCESRKENIALFLTTNGGDAHIAYKLCKTLQRNYKKLCIYIIGPCKSAGTLIALGANELIFGQHGELGPLDIQTDKPDDFFSPASGLDSTESVRVVANQAKIAYHAFFNEILGKGNGTITTTTAGNLAINLTKVFIEPIAQQIDPILLGEMNRKIRVSTEYGERLFENFDEDTKRKRERAVELLTGTYPSHGFVVDIDEASNLFEEGSVRSPDDDETPIVNYLKFQRYLLNDYIQFLDDKAINEIDPPESNEQPDSNDSD